MGKQELSKSLKSYCKGKDRSSESLLCAPVFRNSDPWEKVGHKHFLLLPAIDRVELGRTGEGRTGAKLCQVIQESQTCAALQGLLVEHTKQEQPCFSTYSGSHFLLPRGLGKLSFSRRGSLLKGSREVEVRKERRGAMDPTMPTGRSGQDKPRGEGTWRRRCVGSSLRKTSFCFSFPSCSQVLLAKA